MKVLIVGAGNVGAHIAYLCLFSPRIEDVFLYDINQELLKGKCLDLNHSAGVLKRNLEFIPLEDLEVKADIVIITAGFPRKEGMTRFDLLDANVKIMEEVISELDFSLLKDAIFIIVSNPVDVLTYFFYTKAEIPRQKIVGMAGVLDTGRFRYYLSKKLNKKISEIDPLVIGSHSKDMVPIYRDRESEKVKEAISETQHAGANVVFYYKGGSAYFAPGAGVKIMLDIISEDKKEIIPAVAVLNGEYGYENIAFGIPVKLGRNGIEEIVEIELSPEEKTALDNSIKGIKSSLDYLRKQGKI
jgi:malate dehydrogenase